uniref:Putative methyltransferase PMT21 n=1 Tax=Anthurium amnicola TaxID=1678845 RepID=A0A1D1YES4_9ARAE
MGSMEDHPRKQQQQQGRARLLLKVLLLVLSTNLVTLYLFSGSASSNLRWSEYAPRLHLWDTDALLRELNATQAKLLTSQGQLDDLRHRLTTSNSLLEALTGELRRIQAPAEAVADGGWGEDLSGELKLAVSPHKLPLGHNSNFGSGELYPVLGSACRRYQDELEQYMSYDVGGECPVDDAFAQRLMLKGCEPLPRRRCHPKTPKGYVEPSPQPAALWAIPPDTSIVWEPYTCKNYHCLVNRKSMPGSFDCKDCFDLGGRERVRWMFDNDQLDYGIDQVLAAKPPGTIRIGLDLGGGTGSFAARMRERNVTVVTTSMNFDGPFNSFIASRGLVPIHISISHRLPFFENTLDIVHSMHVLSSWIPDAMLEFALYDIYRVLRPGGLFWLDHFFCLGEQMNATYVPMLDRVGFRRIRWNAGRKLDRGPEKNEWYLSALLEKPAA